ncbi:MAG: ATP-dependent DNA helicase [Nanoarchaeota archaeon]
MSNVDAIKRVKGPCVILAGAGTGKTHTIVEKIKYLIESGTAPDKIVCITFSNEAANNVLLRVEKLLGTLHLNDGKKPIIKTFHSFSADLIRKYGDRIEISKEFKILDPDQAKVILHRNFKINAANCHKYIASIGTAKDLGVKLEEFQNFLANGMREFEGVDLEKRLENLNFELQTLHLKSEHKKKKELVADVKKIKTILELKKFVNAWNAYEKLKKKGNYQDYSDLNVNALILLKQNKEIGFDYEYVIVDEFQDTNKLQLDFLVELAGNGNITVVGDPNQSIYRFRGAYKNNLSLFKQIFKVGEKDVFNLAQSYRSPNKVLKAAHKLILNNYENKEECFFVENVHGREGDNIEVYELKNAREEARKIVELVKKEVENGSSLEDICIMFRAHQHGRIIKKYLESENIPFHSVAKASLLKQKSIKTARDYLMILNKIKKKEKSGEEAWWDLAYQLNFNQEDLIKIGRTIKDFVKKNEKKQEEDKKEEDNEEKLEEVLSVYLFNNLEKIVSEKGRMAAKILIEKIKLMIPFMDKPISEILKEIYKISGLVNEQKTREEKEIMLNLNKFFELAKVHEELYDSDMSNFLYYLDLLESLGIEISASELEEAGVRLMTSHATKGLEYKTVIISNMCQGRFPIERYTSNMLIPTELLPEVKDEIKGMNELDKENYVVSYEKHNQLLEERRLCYVSFTRAKEKLILTYASEYSGKAFSPSTFLNETDYKKNTDFTFVIDNDIKCSEELENDKKFEVGSFLNARDFEESVRNNQVEKKEESKRLSPSALLLFDECQKKFEYKYVYNMPDKKTISWEAMRLGSFVHLILEKGVSQLFDKIEQYLELAKETSLNEDWESVSLNEAETLLRVFFERNNGKYDNRTKTEQYLPLHLSGIDFMGFADRIDVKDNGVEIIDYKTGKTSISPRDRNWQLGFYALAAEKKYGNVRKVVLDMLKQERPLEFNIDEKGNAVCVSSKFIDGFNIYSVRDELIDTAHKIQEAYKSGFKACSIEDNCDFCNEYVYGL